MFRGTAPARIAQMRHATPLGLVFVWPGVILAMALAKPARVYAEAGGPPRCSTITPSECDGRDIGSSCLLNGHPAVCRSLTCGANDDATPYKTYIGCGVSLYDDNERPEAGACGRRADLTACDGRAEGAACEGSTGAGSCTKILCSIDRGSSLVICSGNEATSASTNTNDATPAESGCDITHGNPSLGAGSCLIMVTLAASRLRRKRPTRR